MNSPRIFFNSLNAVNYGGSIDPLSLNPTVYFQVFDTSYLTPTSPSTGTPITEIRKYTDESHSALTVTSSECSPVLDNLNGKDLLYFPANYNSCWPPSCSASCFSSYYETTQNADFMSSSGYSFTLYLVVKPLSGETYDELADNSGYIIDDDPDHFGSPSFPRLSNVIHLFIEKNKNIRFNIENSGFQTILDLPIEFNSSPSDLQSKNLRILSIRANDPRDLITDAAYSYVNGIQTTAVTQSLVTNYNFGSTFSFCLGGNEYYPLGFSSLYQGYFGELIIFNTMHSTDTHSKIITFLKNRWGIT